MVRFFRLDSSTFEALSLQKKALESEHSASELRQLVED